MNRLFFLAIALLFCVGASSLTQAATTTYLYAGNTLLASSSEDEVTYAYQDRLGTDTLTRTLPFGETITSESRFSFTGKELDGGEDLYFYGARYYDSITGKFTSIDPVSENHAYAYVRNNPLNFVDPTGMDEVWYSPTAGPQENYPYMADYKAEPFSDHIGALEFDRGEVFNYFGPLKMSRDKAGLFDTYFPDSEKNLLGRHGDCVTFVCAIYYDYAKKNHLEPVLPFELNDKPILVTLSQWNNGFHGAFGKDLGEKSFFKESDNTMTVQHFKQLFPQSMAIDTPRRGAILVFEHHVAMVLDVIYDQSNNPVELRVMDGNVDTRGNLNPADDLQRTHHVYTLSYSKTIKYGGQVVKYILPPMDELISKKLND